MAATPLVAIEGHYRASGKDLFETLMDEVTDFIETGIDNTSTGSAHMA
jgi:hypothetical protein